MFPVKVDKNLQRQRLTQYYGDEMQNIHVSPVQVLLHASRIRLVLLLQMLGHSLISCVRYQDPKSSPSITWHGLN